MLFVLYRGSGVYSGRALREALNGIYDGEVLGGYPSRLVKLVEKKKGQPEYVVNLGTTDDLSGLNMEATIINGREMVKAGSNKRAARRHFAEVEIPAPTLYLRAGEVTKKSLPVVGRTSYHRKGQGFWFCETLHQVQRAVGRGATHFMEFIPHTREYRVHTFTKARALGQEERTSDDFVSVKISEKVAGEGMVLDPKTPQKNHEFGWTFQGPQNRRDEELDVVREAAKQAIASLGMDFGAVDVMYRIRAKRPYVLEVNSTPSLADDTADTCERYAKRILKTIRNLSKED